MNNINKHIEKLIKMLQSPKPNTRYEACEYLRAAPTITPEAIVALQNALNDPNADVADAAQRALNIQLLPEPAETQSPPASSRLIFKEFAIGGIALILVFVALFVGLGLFITGAGGVDVFIVVAPLCFFSYQLALSVYVGVFMAAFSNSVGKSSWLWGIIGFAMTAGFMYGSNLYDSPPFSLLVPILSTLITLSLIKITRRSTV